MANYALIVITLAPSSYRAIALPIDPKNSKNVLPEVIWQALGSDRIAVVSEATATIGNAPVEVKDRLLSQVHPKIIELANAALPKEPEVLTLSLPEEEMMEKVCDLTGEYSGGGRTAAECIAEILSVLGSFQVSPKTSQPAVPQVTAQEVVVPVKTKAEFQHDPLSSCGSVYQATAYALGLGADEAQRRFKVGVHMAQAKQNKPLQTWKNPVTVTKDDQAWFKAYLQNPAPAIAAWRKGLDEYRASKAAKKAA
jgi:hypothetical protein